MQRAARRYHQVEPENRLVARTLESEWNARLAELAQLEQEYATVKSQPPLALSEQQRRQILSLAQVFPRLWRAGATSQSQRKQLLRLLIEDVTLRNTDIPWGTEVAIRWRTGVVSRQQAEPLVPHPQSTPPQAVRRIAELYGERTDRNIATILNSEGYRTGYCKAFTEGSVSGIRRHWGLTRPPADGKSDDSLHSRDEGGTR